MMKMERANAFQFEDEELRASAFRDKMKQHAESDLGISIDEGNCDADVLQRLLLGAEERASQVTEENTRHERASAFEAPGFYYPERLQRFFRV